MYKIEKKFFDLQVAKFPSKLSLEANLCRV